MANDIPEAKLEAMARLFLAVWPPNHVREMLGELPYEVQRGVRFVSRESLHATLRFLGDANPNEVGEALRSAPLPATTATVGPAIDMLGTHSVIAPVDGLDKLAAASRRRHQRPGHAHTAAHFQRPHHGCPSTAGRNRPQNGGHGVRIVIRGRRGGVGREPTAPHRVDLRHAQPLARPMLTEVVVKSDSLRRSNV